jgi:hypothetical protein
MTPLIRVLWYTYPNVRLRWSVCDTLLSAEPGFVFRNRPRIVSPSEDHVYVILQDVVFDATQYGSVASTTASAVMLVGPATMFTR